MKNEDIDPRVVAFEWWHNAVFGKNPSKAFIPFKIMRDFEDWKWEVCQYNKNHRSMSF